MTDVDNNVGEDHVFLRLTDSRLISSLTVRQSSSNIHGGNFMAYRLQLKFSCELRPQTR